MKVAQEMFTNETWRTLKANQSINPNLVLCFGDKELLSKASYTEDISKKYPGAHVISVSTSGEVSNELFSDKTIVATAIEFEKTKISCASISIDSYNDSSYAGTALASKLPQDGLRFVLVFSDGMKVNGGDMVVAMNEVFENRIPVAGGLAGDGIQFNETMVGLNQNISSGNIVAVGFYGRELNIGFGSKGGWSQFGPARTVTHSEKNILYELDGNNALDLYKNYLGDFSNQLPSAALNFPLSVENEHSEEVVRTVLNIDEKNKAMTFAGNVPAGSKVRFMKTTQHHLIEAASLAAATSNKSMQSEGEKLSLLISCVGRKIILGSRVDEELEAVREVLGNEVTLAGFYSHGEIAPNARFIKCDLHNQTMTITTLSE